MHNPDPKASIPPPACCIPTWIPGLSGGQWVHGANCRGAAPEPRYFPDMDGLWLLYADLHHTGNRLERIARWRIPADDWDHIRRWSPGGAALGATTWHPVEPPRPPDLQWRLLGLPVEVTPPGVGYPELVLTMDRRTA